MTNEKKFDPKTGERIIKQDGKTYRQDWKGDWKPDTDWKGDPKVETDWKGDPKIETDWKGDQKIETDWKGDPIVPPDKTMDRRSSGGSSGGASGGSGGSGDVCFLTTACVEYARLPDDCRELRTMRAFRDQYISASSDAATLVAEYYQLAPGIVQRIKADVDAEAVFQSLLVSLREAVTLIETGRSQDALALSVMLFNDMKKRYGPKAVA